MSWMRSYRLLHQMVYDHGPYLDLYFYCLHSYLPYCTTYGRKEISIVIKMTPNIGTSSDGLELDSPPNAPNSSSYSSSLRRLLLSILHGMAYSAAASQSEARLVNFFNRGWPLEERRKIKNQSSHCVLRFPKSDSRFHQKIPMYVSYAPDSSVMCSELSSFCVYSTTKLPHTPSTRAQLNQ